MDRRNLLRLMSGVFSALGWKAGQKIAPALSQGQTSMVGAWHLQTPGAPILHHVLLFHADGVVCSFQADGGFPNDSESDGAGAWKFISRDQVKGAFLEFRYDRESHAYLGYVRVEFELSMHGETFSGRATARIYDAQGNLLAQVPSTWAATRITIR